MVLVMVRKEDGAAVSIPPAVYKKLEARIRGSEFSTVSDYVTFVLTELLAEEEKAGQPAAMSSEDEAKVKERLRALGYID